jgi:hypothetical protein
MIGYLQELRARAVKIEMTEIPAKMDSIVEAVIYGRGFVRATNRRRIKVASS